MFLILVFFYNIFMIIVDIFVHFEMFRVLDAADVSRGSSNSSIDSMTRMLSK